MPDLALKDRGIEDANDGNLLVGLLPYPGRVKLTVRAGCQDLDRAGAHHLVRLAVRHGLAQWPNAKGELVALIVDECARAGVSVATEVT